MRVIGLLYGIVAYAVGMAGLLFFILYIGGWSLGGLMPRHIDAIPEPGASMPLAYAINVGLILVFALQHSIMARPWFKETWTAIIPKGLERSTYVLITGAIFIGIVLLWQPIHGLAWTIADDTVRTIILAIQIFGWAMAVAATFLINHFELFGLQQSFHHFKQTEPPRPTFVVRSLYRIVRHPLQLGFIIAFWASPTMSMTHVMLSGLLTIYIVIALFLEERDLVTFLGDDYVQYQKRVRKLIPIPKRAKA